MKPIMSKLEFLEALGLEEKDFPKIGEKRFLQKRYLSNEFLRTLQDWKRDYWGTGQHGREIAYIAQGKYEGHIEVAAGWCETFPGDEGGTFTGLGFWARYNPENETISNIVPVPRAPGLWAQRGVLESLVVGKYVGGRGNQPILVCDDATAFYLLRDAIYELRFGRRYPFLTMQEAVENSAKGQREPFFTYEELRPKLHMSPS